MFAKLRLIPQALLPISHRLIDGYLSLDPDYFQDLKELAGKQIYFYIKDFNLSIEMKFTRTQLKLNYQKNESSRVEGDLLLKGRSIDLLAFALKKNQRSKLLSTGVVEFEGELFLLETLVKLFKERNFFKNLPLPPLLKQVLMLSFNKANAWQQHSRSVMQHTIVDYLQEELQYLPSYRLFKLCQDDLMHLDAQLDRLEAKLNLVDARSES